MKTIDPKLGPLTVGVFVENDFEPMHFPIELDVRDEHGFVPDGQRPTIAKVCYGDNPQEMLATARFLAAAPDLLAALERMIETPFMPVSEQTDAFNAARAAVACARGEGEASA